MARTSRTTFELRAGSLSETDLDVRAVSGWERISEPFAWQVAFEPRAGEPLDLEALVGADALLTVRRPGGPSRLVHGVLADVALAAVAAGRPAYRATLVPRLARLAHARRSRVFQQRSAPEIVAQVLDEAGVEHREAFAGTHPSREMCLQYGETDLAFVSRLLEEEGIFYFFEHSDDAHVMVLADAASACADLPDGTSLPYRPGAASGEAEDLEHVDGLARRGALAPAKVTLRDFDFTRPALELTASADAGDAGPEIYEHPGRFCDAGAGRDAAARRLEELRFPVRAFHGAGNCVRLAPGLAFEVTDHPDPAFGSKLLAVDVKADGRAAGPGDGTAGIDASFRAAFVAIETSAPLRPPRRTRRPRAAAESATVAGPSGEEVHPDAHGRVKVRFHWDREAKGDDTSSAWIRLAQLWAGPGFGASFVPRVGQEVLIRFLDGDPDRPLIVGAVYNGDHPPPLPLPGDRTQSTLRTSSSPGGDGANELHFEDQAGAEAISIHAQRDERIEVLNDKAQVVRGAEGLEVAKDRSREVLGAQRLDVARVDAAVVEGNASLTVAGSRRVFVGASHVEDVGGQSAVTVGGKRTVIVDTAAAENVLAAAALTVGGVYAVTVGGVANTAVGAARAVQVGAARMEYVAGSRDEAVEKDSAQKTAGDATLEIDGRLEITVEKDDTLKVQGASGCATPELFTVLAKRFDLKGTDAFRILVAGKVAFEAKKSGAVTLAGKDITWDGSKIVTKGSTVKKISGGSPPSGRATVRQLSSSSLPQKASVDVSLADQGGEAFANEPFKVEFPDGTVVEGTLDAAGKASVTGPKPGNVKVSFPRLDQKAWKDG